MGIKSDDAAGEKEEKSLKVTRSSAAPRRNGVRTRKQLFSQRGATASESGSRFNSPSFLKPGVKESRMGTGSGATQNVKHATVGAHTFPHLARPGKENDDLLESGAGGAIKSDGGVTRKVIYRRRLGEGGGGDYRAPNCNQFQMRTPL